MIDRFRTILVASSISVGAIAAAQASDLPADRRDAVVCLYKNLRALPHVTDVDVYVDAKQRTTIEYTFKDSHGKSESTDISISGPNTSGRFQYVGDFMYSDNPLADAVSALSQKCRADGGYVDQVIITGPSDNPQKWRVDMSKYEQ